MIEDIPRFNEKEERTYIKHILGKGLRVTIVLKDEERERVVIEAGKVGRVLCYELLEEIEAISGREKALSAIKSIESRRWEKNGRH